MRLVKQGGRNFILFITQELAAGLIGVEQEGDNKGDTKLKIISYMPLDDLDPVIVSLIRRETPVTHFAFFQAAVQIVDENNLEDEQIETKAEKKATEST